MAMSLSSVLMSTVFVAAVFVVVRHVNNERARGANFALVRRTTFCEGIRMATPKGMRAVQLPVNETDAVHIYSDDHHIWLQLRRYVPTEREIGRPSFKVALCLTPGTAHKLGLELLNVAERNKDKQKAKIAATTPNAASKQPAAKPKQPQPKQQASPPTAK